MDQVLEQVADWIEAGLALLLGGVLAIWSVTGHIQEKRLEWTGRVVLLSVGTASMAFGLLYLLNLLDLVREQWLLLIGSMINGVLGLMVATDRLPFWRIADISEKRWMFLWGVFWTLFALVYAVILDLP